MGRPKASAEQQVFARDKFYGGLTPKAILIELEQKHDEPVSLRTVERWCRVFRQSETPEDKLMNSPFELHRLGEYGLPWESGEYLADVWYQLQGGWWWPSARVFVWLWRVHLMVPDLTYNQAWQVAHLYSLRESTFELHGIDPSNSDINGFLAFKPWRSQGRLDNFNDAVNKGKLKPLLVDRAGGIFELSLFLLLFSREQIDQLDYLTEEHKQRIERFRKYKQGVQQ